MREPVLELAGRRVDGAGLVLRGSWNGQSRSVEPSIGMVALSEVCFAVDAEPGAEVDAVSFVRGCTVQSLSFSQFRPQGLHRM